MVLFEAVRTALEFLGVHGQLALGAALVIVGVYYSRHLAGVLSRAAGTISIAALVLGSVGIALLVAVGLGVVTIDGGLLGALLRALGGLVAVFGGIHP